MTTEILQPELKSALLKAGLKEIDDATMSKCFATAFNLHLTYEQVVTCWESYSFNKKTSSLDDKSFEAFKNILLRETPSAVIPMSESSSPRGAVLPPRSAPLPHVTPPAKRFHASEESSRRVSLRPGPPVELQPSDKYENRTGAGQVVSTYASKSLVSSAAEAQPLSRPKCSISYDFESNRTDAYRYMFTTTEQRSNALDQRLEDMGRLIIEKYQLGKTDDATPLEGVGIPRADEVCCIGRICNAAHEGRINSTSVLLEGSRLASGGARVPVDFSLLQSNKTSYSVFPGQIVALEGMNPSGRKLQVRRFCEGAAAEPMCSRVDDLKQWHYQEQEGQPLKLIAAAGPFTTSDNFNYQPLQDLLHVVKSDRPDVVILTGPFVDMEHKAVKSGQTALQDEDGNDIIVPYETFFVHKVSVLLEDLLNEDSTLMTQFVLIPSLEDATAEWVYPQPPFQDRVPGGLDTNIPGGEGIRVGYMGLDYVETTSQLPNPHRRVHCVPNPCTLQINEVVIGVTSTDVLFHMSADEANANLLPGSRMTRISQHLLQQRSYYPLFPPAPSMNMDLQYMEQWSMPCQPDLLIVPSKLACFSQTVMDSTIVVNPGRLTRDTVGGTYAVMEVHPFAKEDLEKAGDDDAEMQHAIHERTQVQIKRI